VVIMMLLDPHARPIIAHRGFSARAPENTLLAFRMAVEAGADAIELDVQLTADGHVVVCHDDTVDRTTSGTGRIGQLSLAHIRELDAGRGERIPLLSEVLDAFASVPTIIELKTRAVAEPALAVLARMAAGARVLVGSFMDDVLPLARRAGFRTTAGEGELRRLLPRAWMSSGARPQPFDAVAMPPARYGLPLPVGGYVRAAGVPVHVWTVNDAARARRLWSRGVCGIVTDDPAAMLQVRA
jgi:glycerophosphoryl diester phosphodiesterase